MAFPTGKSPSLPHLEEGERALLALAADDARDVAPLSDKEALILQLHHRVEEQKLEKALLEQGWFFFYDFFFFFAPLYDVFSLNHIIRTRRNLRRRQCRATCGRRTGAARGESYLYSQEESRRDGSYD